MSKIDRESLPKMGSNEYSLHKVFTQLLFDILNIPSFEEREECDKALKDNNIVIAYNSDTCEYAIGVNGDEFEPMLVLNTNLILQLMKQNHPLRPVAEQFKDRECGNLITLDEAIELNKNGKIVIAPHGDDRIHIYGIGTLANSLRDQTIEFGIGSFLSEQETVFYYVPSHQDKFISTDDFDDMVAVLNSLKGGTLEAYPVVAYNDPDRGFVVEVKGVDTFGFTIYEDGNIYGSGLVMEV